MLECIPYEFDKYINFILDCFEEATPYSWPGTNRTEKARYLDYEYFKHMDLNENIVNMLVNQDEFIGFLWCSIRFNKIEERKYCHANFIYVTPQYRGKGYVQYLMNKLEDIASVNKTSIISLEVIVSNISAKKLYEKEGYVTRRYTMQKELK